MNLTITSYNQKLVAEKSQKNETKKYLLGCTNWNSIGQRVLVSYVFGVKGMEQTRNINP